MTENWNLAVGNTSGEWVILLGGDDAIRRNALLKIEQVIESTDVESITWSQSFYTWDNFGVPDKSQLLFIPPATNEIVVSDVIFQFSKFNVGEFSDLPTIYYGCIKRSLIDRALESGPLFESRCPDLFSSVIFGFLTTSFARINNPLTIAGFSGSSSITAHLTNLESLSEVTLDAKNLLSNSNVSRHKLIPELNLQCTWILDSLLIARERLQISDDLFQITPDRVARIIESELHDTFNLNAEEMKVLKLWSEEWNQRIELPVKSNDKQMQLNFLPFNGEVGKLGNFFLVNCRDLGVQNILEALDYLDKVEKVYPLLEMAHQDLVERVKKYEEDLIELRTKQ